MRNLLTPLVIITALHAAPALAEPFAGADLEAGRKLHAEHCVACHARQFGGEDGTAIYTRPDRRITSAEGLAQQVTVCTTQLDLALFPEDELNIAGYLNTRYYKFK